MSSAELEQLTLLAQVDELIERLKQWTEVKTAWEPMNHCRAVLRRLLRRVETLRIRLEAPLMVATFGGTGTGKSSLVNALVGKECTPAGRQRPTTMRPVLIAHPQAQLEAFGLPLEEVDVVRIDSPLLRDIVLLDCPDPDTTEAETAGSNLARLHRLLPFCDVLIYTSTQQKYRSARVTEELGEAAAGCRLLFVQTHAGLDEDIRDDWRRQLSAQYEVPELFFVDSLRAFHEEQEGKRPGGDFARLRDTLTAQLAASQRIVVRRANLLDLVQAALTYCRTELARHTPAVEQLEAALEEQRRKLTTEMARQVHDELLSARSLWERRLLGAVTTRWGFSPFSSVLRLYHGLGSLIASTTLFRARTSAQMALIGAVQGVRWLTSRRKEKRKAARVEELAALNRDDEALRESRFVLSGYLQSARLDPALLETDETTEWQEEAARVEEEFLGDTSRRVDRIIAELADRNTGWFTRAWYETLFSAYIVFILFRVGKNFFYDSFLQQFVEQNPPPAVSLVTVDFWITAGVFFLIWSGLLVMSFCGRLRRGLNRRIEELAAELSSVRLSAGLFPRLEQACRQIDRQRQRLDALCERVAELRSTLAGVPQLGAPRQPHPPAESQIPV